MQMVMTSDETQIQTFANWPMSHAKRVTRDNRKNPEYHVVANCGQTNRVVLKAVNANLGLNVKAGVNLNLSEILGSLKRDQKEK